MGNTQQCTWCPAHIGEEHASTCVCRTRTIIIKVTIEMERKVPEFWNPDMINFHMNGSSWCASNIISELESMFGSEERCLCDDFIGEYVREATEVDEAHYGLTVE